MADTTKPLVKLVCGECGGDDCGYEATASWSVAAQALELGSHFDQSWCNECGDVELKRVPITAEEHAEAQAIAATFGPRPISLAHQAVAGAVKAMAGPRYGWFPDRTRALAAAALANALATADPDFDRAAFMAASGVADIEAD